LGEPSFRVIGAQECPVAREKLRASVEEMGDWCINSAPRVLARVALLGAEPITHARRSCASTLGDVLGGLIENRCRRVEDTLAPEDARDGRASLRRSPQSLHPVWWAVDRSGVRGRGSAIDSSPV